MNATTLTLALTAALGSAGLAHATDSNPFAMQSLKSGYMVAAAETNMDQPKTMDETKAKDGKCGTGKCGAKTKAKAKDSKAKDGKCGAMAKDAKAADGKCGGAMAKDGKAADGKCGAGMDSKAKDGKCGAGKM